MIMVSIDDLFDEEQGQLTFPISLDRAQAEAWLGFLAGKGYGVKYSATVYKELTAVTPENGGSGVPEKITGVNISGDMAKGDCCVSFDFFKDDERSPLVEGHVDVLAFNTRDAGSSIPDPEKKRLVKEIASVIADHYKS